jgi:uncharacterized RDD family membrane protein YckC
MPRPAMPEPTSPDAAGARRQSLPGASPRVDLPLFGKPESADDIPLVSAPAVPRTPLSVRRAPPPAPRAERIPVQQDEAPGSPRIVRARDDRSGLNGYPREVPPAPPQPEPLVAASAISRIGAALVDLIVVGGIDAAVVYFTLRVVNVPLAEIWSIPLTPFAVFLLLLNGGYLTVFTTAGGQTIGKMLTGIKVVANPSAEGATRPGHSVSLAASVLRATAYLVSLLPAGLGFAAILFDSDGRALHDRLAETRVVKA